MTTIPSGSSAIRPASASAAMASESSGHSTAPLVHSGAVNLAHPRTGGLFDSPVPPGAGWPGDPATARTAVAAEPGAGGPRWPGPRTTLEQLDAEISVCRACPRLVEWREESALTKRRSFADEPYWGRPVPGWGDRAPADHRRRPGTGGQRRQPNRPGVHRRSLRRLPVRGVAPGRPGQLADRRRRRRWLAAQRHSRGCRGAMRAARECADAGRARRHVRRG